MALVRYVHPSDVPRYLDLGWRSIGIDPRYRSQLMTADDGAEEPGALTVLAQRGHDDL